MPEATMVHVRVDEQIRTAQTRAVADRKLPFALDTPNAATRAAMREARTMGQARFTTAKALIDDLGKARKR